MGKNVEHELVGGEVAASMSEQIEKRVNEIRNLKFEIEDIRTATKIDKREEQIEKLRGELLDLATQYHELTGTNWQDDEGYCRYVSPSTSNKYDTKLMDEALSGALGILGQLVAEVDDRLDSDSKGLLSTVMDGNLPFDYADAGELAGLLKEVQAERQRVVEHVLTLANGIDVMLKKAAAARSTTRYPSKVAVK